MAEEVTFTKADIDAAVKEAVMKVEETLGAKRDELLGEVKTLRQELRKSKEIDPSDLVAAEERAEKAESALNEANKQVKALTAEREKLAKQVESESGFTSKLLVQDGIKSALIAVGVKDNDFLDALTTKFAIGASVVATGDARTAMIGDKAVPDVIKDWAASDAGKKFVAAALNSGGSAPGGNGGVSNTKTMTRSQYDKQAIADPAGVRSFIKEGGTIVNEAA